MCQTPPSISPNTVQNAFSLRNINSNTSQRKFSTPLDCFFSAVYETESPLREQYIDSSFSPPSIFCQFLQQIYLLLITIFIDYQRNFRRIKMLIYTEKNNSNEKTKEILEIELRTSGLGKEQPPTVSKSKP